MKERFDTDKKKSTEKVGSKLRRHKSCCLRRARTKRESSSVVPAVIVILISIFLSRVLPNCVTFFLPATHISTLASFSQSS